MTPEFNFQFKILKRTLDAFNQRCSCEKIHISIKFILDTQSDNWLGKVVCDVFGDASFEGSLESVTESINKIMIDHTNNLIESMVANLKEWYQNKPDVQTEIMELYFLMKVVNSKETSL